MNATEREALPELTDEQRARCGHLAKWPFSIHLIAETCMQEGIAIGKAERASAEKDAALFVKAADIIERESENYRHAPDLDGPFQFLIDAREAIRLNMIEIATRLRAAMNAEPDRG